MTAYNELISCLDFNVEIVYFRNRKKLISKALCFPPFLLLGTDEYLGFL